MEGSARAYLEQLDGAVSADLNTAQALAVLTQLARDPAVAADDLAVLVGTFEAVLAVGLLDLVPEDLDPPAREVLLEAAEVERLLNEREEARGQRDFATADEIREMLERLGIEVRDTSEGTVWKVRPAIATRPTGRSEA